MAMTVEARQPDIIQITGEKEPGEVLISHDMILERLKRMAPEMVQAYEGMDVLGVTVMKGGMVTATHLSHALHRAGMEGLQMTHITAKSYGSGTESSGKLNVIGDVDIDPQGRHVLLLEDIIDTGLTLSLLHQLFLDRGAASVESFALVSKPSRREVAYEAGFVGFEIPNIWIQGFGMDTDERGRNHPDIIVGPW